MLLFEFQTACTPESSIKQFTDRMDVWEILLNLSTPVHLVREQINYFQINQLAVAISIPSKTPPTTSSGVWPSTSRNSC